MIFKVIVTFKSDCVGLLQFLKAVVFATEQRGMLISNKYDKKKKK